MRYANRILSVIVVVSRSFILAIAGGAAAVMFYCFCCCLFSSVFCFIYISCFIAVCTRQRLARFSSIYIHGNHMCVICRLLDRVSYSDGFSIVGVL